MECWMWFRWLVLRAQLFSVLGWTQQQQQQQQEEDVGIGSVRQQVVKLVKEALAATVPELTEVEPQVSVCGNPKNGDYQW
jgi:hypothetical protein